MNVFLAITEDGYSQQSEKAQFDWLEDELKDPAEN